MEATRKEMQREAQAKLTTTMTKLRFVSPTSYAATFLSQANAYRKPYKQIAHIPAGKARRDALRLTKKEKSKLPRVTAYCSAGSYQLADVQKFFNARRSSHHTDVRQFDDVLYTPYSYEGPRNVAFSHQATELNLSAVGDLLGVPDLSVSSETTTSSHHHSRSSTAAEDDVHISPTQSRRRVKRRTNFDKTGSSQPMSTEVFVFEFGTVVCWGMTEAQEKRFLSSMYGLRFNSFDILSLMITSKDDALR